MPFSYGVDTSHTAILTAKPTITSVTPRVIANKHGIIEAGIWPLEGDFSIVGDPAEGNTRSHPEYYSYVLQVEDAKRIAPFG